MSRIQILNEAMTAEELSAAQNEHYALDDQIRRTTGRLTAKQKQDVVDFIKKISPPKEG